MLVAFAFAFAASVSVSAASASASASAAAIIWLELQVLHCEEIRIIRLKLMNFQEGQWRRKSGHCALPGALLTQTARIG